MSNMSYCRFHNTRQDLAEAKDWLDETDGLGTEEAKERNRLLLLCATIAEDWADEIEVLREARRKP